MYSTNATNSNDFIIMKSDPTFWGTGWGGGR